MANDTITITFEDVHGKQGTFQIPVRVGGTPLSAELVALVQEITDASLCIVRSCSLTQAMALPASNPVAEADIGNDSVEQQVAFQAKRADNGGFTRFSIPAPRDLLFETVGPYAGADVKDDEATLSAPLIAALGAVFQGGEVWEAPGGLAVNYDKGWRKGRKHS